MGRSRDPVRGDLNQPVTDSAVPEQLPGTSIVVFDSALRVREASGTLLRGGRFARGCEGQEITAAVAVDDPESLRTACEQAIAGHDATLTCSTHGGARSFLVRVAAAPGGGISVWTDTTEVTRSLELERARSRELTDVWTVARQLARCTQLEEARTGICELARELLGADRAFLFELDGAEEVLRATAAAAAEPAGLILPMTESSAAILALRTNTRRWSGDPGSESRAVAALAGASGSAALLWQPIARGRTVRAMLALGWNGAVPQLEERSERLLDFIAVEGAVAFDRGAAVERLIVMARTDPMTGLPNRRAWEESLHREVARASRDRSELSIGLVDLDGFKVYNDTHGHVAGDRLLHAIAARWGGLIRASDVLARWGGDEFALGLPACSLAEAEELIGRLLEATAGYVRCSAGIVAWDGRESAAELLTRADRALYAAKASAERTIIVG